MSNENEYNLVCPFWIDTESYTNRDRFMFVCGAEFEIILNAIRRIKKEKFQTTIHRENESRVRMACGRFGRKCTIRQCEESADPQGMWSYLEIEPTKN